MDDAAEILFQSFLREAVRSSSGTATVQSLMLSVQYFLIRPRCRPPSRAPLGWFWRTYQERALASRLSLSTYTKGFCCCCFSLFVCLFDSLQDLSEQTHSSSYKWPFASRVAATADEIAMDLLGRCARLCLVTKLCLTRITLMNQFHSLAVLCYLDKCQPLSAQKSFCLFLAKKRGRQE